MSDTIANTQTYYDSLSHSGYMVMNVIVLAAAAGITVLMFLANDFRSAFMVAAMAAVALISLTAPDPSDYDEFGFYEGVMRKNISELEGQEREDAIGQLFDSRNNPFLPNPENEECKNLNGEYVGYGFEILEEALKELELNDVDSDVIFDKDLLKDNAKAQEIMTAIDAKFCPKMQDKARETWECNCRDFEYKDEYYKCQPGSQKYQDAISCKK